MGLMEKAEIDAKASIPHKTMTIRSMTFADRNTQRRDRIGKVGECRLGGYSPKARDVVAGRIRIATKIMNAYGIQTGGFARDAHL